MQNTPQKKKKKNLWQRDFDILFDFRTFYPDGVLFVAPVSSLRTDASSNVFKRILLNQTQGTKSKPKHFVSLVLRDGQLSFLVVSGRKREEKRVPVKLNDGHWHHVHLTSVNKKLTIRVEMEGSNGGHVEGGSTQIRLPKHLGVSNNMHIGGIGNMLLDGGDVFLPVENSMLEQFKGCIRRFRVNNHTYDLAMLGNHLNVGQCFPRVEKGSYFPGDAYAVYGEYIKTYKNPSTLTITLAISERKFHVGKHLELQFEFRTSELNGVLLSVSEQNGFPALSIELFGGKVRFFIIKPNCL